MTDDQAIRSISIPSYLIVHRELMNVKGPRAEALPHVFIINHEPVEVQVSEEASDKFKIRRFKLRRFVQVR